MLVEDRITTKALRLLVVFVSIVAVASIGISLHRLGGSLTLSYLPNGIAVAATYRFGRRVWPAVFLAGMSIVLWTHEPLPASIGVGIGLAGFLGVGIPPPTPTWGNMLADSLNAGLVPPWWLVLFPGAAITLTVLAFNLLGDGIRDALDPRLRGAV